MIISTYKNEGPYYAPTRWSREVSGTPEFLRTIREAMEEDADYVGVFDDEGACKGIWQREAEGEYGEGECYDVMYVVNQCYVLERPDNSWSFNYALKRLAV
jgi:hypothetical protein